MRSRMEQSESARYDSVRTCPNSSLGRLDLYSFRQRDAEAWSQKQELYAMEQELEAHDFSRERMSRAAFGESFELWIRTDRKSTRLNSSHVRISYAVFCLKKNKKISVPSQTVTCHHKRLPSRTLQIIVATLAIASGQNRTGLAKQQQTPQWKNPAAARSRE